MRPESNEKSSCSQVSMFDKLGALLNESIKNGFIPDTNTENSNSSSHVQTEPIIPEILLKKLKILKLGQDATYSIAKKNFHEQLKKTHPDIQENHIGSLASGTDPSKSEPHFTRQNTNDFDSSAKITNTSAQAINLKHQTELLLEDWNLIEKWNDKNKLD